MKFRFLLTGCASVFALVAAANAQEVTNPSTTTPPKAKAGGRTEGSGKSKSEDIIVTASKGRAQRLVQAPLTVQSFSAKDLASKDIKRVEDLITAIPGAAISGQIGEFARTYSIRGSGYGGGVGDGLVGYYIDDVPYVIPNSSIAPSLNFLDLDHVEVLRGPYGTLYGAGAEGGTIIFHTKDPSLTTFSADGEADISGTKHAGSPNGGGALAVSIPIIKDKLGVRISAGDDYQAGYANIYAGSAPTGNPIKSAANNFDQTNFRVNVLYEPTDDITLKLQYFHFDGFQNYSQQVTSVNPPSIVDYSDAKGYNSTSNNLYSATLSANLGFATLTNSLGYLASGTSYVFGYNLGLGAGSLYDGFGGNSFTEELRLTSNGGPFHWLGGLFYNDAIDTFSQGIDFPIPILNGLTGASTATSNIAGFGEASYDLFGGKLVPLVGVRVYHDDRTGTDFTGPAPGVTTETVGTYPTVATWRANLSYHPENNMTVFFNAGTGFRDGIIQTQTQLAAEKAGGITGQIALNPDSLTNYELGIKQLLPGSGIRYELDLYHLKYSNLQQGFYTPSGVASFASLGSATVQGIDFTGQWSPAAVPGVTIGFDGDLNDSRYDQVDPVVAAGVGNIADGSRFLFNPPWTARFDIGYSHPLGDDLTIYANVSDSLQGHVKNQVNQETPIISIVNASLGLRRKRYDLELFAENLTDEHGPWYIGNVNIESGPIPLTAGFRLRFHYQ